MKNKIDLLKYTLLTKSEQGKIQGGNTSIVDWTCTTHIDYEETDYLPSGCQ